MIRWLFLLMMLPSLLFCQDDDTLSVKFKSEDITLTAFISTDSIPQNDTLNLKLSVKIKGLSYQYDIQDPQLDYSNLRLIGSSSSNKSDGEYSYIEFSYFFTPINIGMAYIEPVNLGYLYRPDENTGNLRTERYSITVTEPLKLKDNSRLWYYIIAGIILIIGFLITLYFSKRKKEEEVVEEIPISLYEELSKEFNELKTSVDREDYPLLFHNLMKILDKYLVGKIDQRLLNCPKSRIQELLFEQGIRSNVIKSIIKSIELDNLVRFGKGKLDRDEVNQILNAYSALIDSTEIKSKEDDNGESSTSGNK